MTRMNHPAPRITMAVLAYRQSAFIDDAVRSALGQIGEPIEIVLSDDCSPDDTYERMQALAAAYDGPHQVVVRRNERNLGITAHYNEVMKTAKGDLVVVMAGDDISLPERVSVTAQAWEATGHLADLLACDVIDMSFENKDLGTLQVDDLAQWRGVEAWARKRPYVIGAGHAVTRRLFERFGPLQPGVMEEDQVNTLRALCSGGAVTMRRALVRYRRGGISSGSRPGSAQDFLLQMQRKNRNYLALLRQWHADAGIAGCTPMVESATRRTLDRETFLADLLLRTDLSGRLDAVRRAASVDIGWRLKKLLHMQFPGFSAGTRNLQDRWKP